jgi:hypothetical protein
MALFAPRENDCAHQENTGGRRFVTARAGGGTQARMSQPVIYLFIAYLL